MLDGFQLRSSTADVFGPRSSGNSWVARLNRPPHGRDTSRNGSRAGVFPCCGSEVFGAMSVASESTADVSAGSRKRRSNVNVDPAPSLSILICPTEISPSQFRCELPRARAALHRVRSGPAGRRATSAPPAVRDQFAVGGEQGRRTAEVASRRRARSGRERSRAARSVEMIRIAVALSASVKTRAQAYQHTTQRRAETAQAFKPWRIPSRKCWTRRAI